MNCKPGDLAVVIGSFSDDNLGMLVEVMHAAPKCKYLLPDGVLMHGENAKYQGWMVKTLCRPFVRVGPDGFDRGLYAQFPDYRLRPLPRDKDSAKATGWTEIKAPTAPKHAAEHLESALAAIEQLGRGDFGQP